MIIPREQIEKIAKDYLFANGCPIVVSFGKVTLPEDEVDLESKKYLGESGLARVSFRSKYFDDPEHELDPGVYIAYVNMITGEVDVPPQRN